MQPLLPWERNKYCVFWVCVYSLKYPAWEAQVYIISSSVVCPNLQLFPYRIFREKRMLLNIKMCFSFSLQILSETFLILRRIRRDIITNVHGFSCKVPDILVRFLMKLLSFFSTDFRIIEEISWKSVQRELSYYMRSEVLTHIHEEANNHVSQFCERS